MKTMIHRPGTWAILLCALAGCDSVKDVRSGPFTPLPLERGVLKGVINGLGGGRSITLKFSDNPNDVGSFLGAQPDKPTNGPAPIPFDFGSQEVGTPFNVKVIQQPFGKNCVPDESTSTGSIETGQQTNVVINCTNTIPRYDLTVRIPAAAAVFVAAPEARVTVTTGEQMVQKFATEAVPVGDHLELKFEQVLFNATGQPAPLQWSVSAAFTDPDGLEGRCQVTTSTGTNPATHVSTPLVGLLLTQTTSACQFTVTGSVAYSAPPGGTAETGAIPGGLLLELRDTQARVLASTEVDEYGTFTFTDGSGNPVQLSSTINSVYDVAVKRHPTDRACVVGDGGAVSLYRDGTFNPVDITPVAAPGARTIVAAATNGVTTYPSRAWGTRLNVFCRALPAAQKRLSGTFRPTQWVWSPVTGDPATVTYDNYDISKHNAGSSDMITLFDDGTFLFGTQSLVTYTPANTAIAALGLPALPSGQLRWETSGAGGVGRYSVQVEHGFYDYVDPDGDPSTPDGKLQFTLITDTNPLGTFPATFGAVLAPTQSANGRVGTGGLSAMPGPVVTGTPVAGAGIGIWNAVLNNVQKTSFTFGRGVNPDQSLSRITGTFGTSPKLDWTLTEPQSVDNEMTGAWVTRDHRRFWVWDYLTYYGMHVGVLGGAPSLNGACFTLLDVHVSSGIYTRRGSASGCYPYDRPLPGASFTTGFIQSVDFHLTDASQSSNVFVGVPGLQTAGGVHVSGSRLDPQFGTPTNALTSTATLPGYVGRIPGGNVAADGRSPSPTLFLVAPASTFASKVASTFFTDVGRPASLYFDNLDAVGAFTDWCQTEILAIRTTLNGLPSNYPIYFCRNKAL